MINEFHFTGKQQAHLLLLKNSLNESLFKNKGEVNAFMIKFGNDWQKRAFELFDKGLLIENLGSISVSNTKSQYENSIPGDPIDEKSPCNCKTESIWTCVGNTEDCKFIDCTKASSGCGFLGLYECDVRCTLR